MYDPSYTLYNIPPIITNQFGKVEISGTATFTLHSMTFQSIEDRHFPDDRVTLSNISNIKYISSASLPNGTKLYENRKPIAYKDIEVSLLNLSYLRNNRHNLAYDVAKHLPKIHEKELRIIDVIDVKRNDKFNSPVRIVLVKHKDTHYYVALDYRNSPLYLGEIEIHALVAKLKGDQKIALEHVLKTIQSWTPNLGRNR